MDNYYELVRSVFGEFGNVDYLLIRTSNYRVLNVDEESFVVYNRILNSPILVEKEAMDWLLCHNKITYELYMSVDENTKEVLQYFIEAYLYLPFSLTEQKMCDKINSFYMYEFRQGKTFEWLDLRVSEVCNFGCSHCIAHSANHNRIMTLEVAIRTVDDYVKFKKWSDINFNSLKIHFGNCEPLLNFGVIQETVNHISKKYPEYEKEYSINTNLTLLTEEMATFFIQNSIEVYTSLDGPEAGNDSIRTYKNGKGTYQDIMKKIEMMKVMGKPIGGISVTITDINYEFLNDDFIQWCRNMNFQSVAYDFDLINATSIAVEEKARFLCDTWEKFSSVGIEFYGTWITPFLKISNYSASNSAYAFCKAMMGKNLSVDATGNIYACSYSDYNICTFDNIKKSIDKGGKYYNLVAEHLVGCIIYPECRDCEFEGACNGQCNQTRAHANSLTVREQCNYYKTVTNMMLKIQAKKLREEVKENES